MGEFELQKIVDNILHHLSSSEIAPQEVVDYLQKNLDQNQSLTCSGVQLMDMDEIQPLLDKIEDPEPFLGKYHDLQAKNVDCLNLFVQLLNKISQDTNIKEFLGRTKKRQSHGGTGSTNFSKDNIPHIKNVLKEALKQTPKGDLSSIVNLSSSLAVASTPSMLSWVQRKPSMSLDFSTTSLSCSHATVPEISQENILIEDLLNILMGVGGNYIEPEELLDPYGPRTFRINTHVPAALQELVRQILPLASHYSMIQRFTEEKTRFEFGQVNNALAEAFHSVVNDHMMFVVQLETEAREGRLTLQKMWFYSQRNMQCLGVAADIAYAISKSDAIGGRVLSLLHDKVINSSGDEQKQQLCVKLMEDACVPYMRILEMWIFMGIISDPFNEFLVEDNEVVQKEEMPADYSADYWDKKYWIRRERIPKFLESVSDDILKAGKYLNVIRQCGKLIKNKIQPIEYKIEKIHYIEAIHKAYTNASRTLLDLVMKEQDLIKRLKSVKYYFLLDKGDFIVTLLNLCEKEFNKPTVDVMQGRLEALMDLALRLTSAANDPYKEDLKTELLPYNLLYQMYRILSIKTTSEQDFSLHIDPKTLTAIESFTFVYEVRWPLSLILNKKSMVCYQMLFRHLFYSKYVERLLCQVWKSNKVAKKFHCEDAKHYRAAFVLRQKMLHCVQNLEYHMMVEVIEPHWNTFMQKIHKVHNIDEILECHKDFLDSCLKDCMLTMPVILGTIVNILNICVEFCKFMQRMERYFVEAELGSLPNSLYESFTQNDFALQSSTSTTDNMSFKSHIDTFEGKFLSSILKLLTQINDLNRDTSEHDRLFNLLYRLNFNSFYNGAKKNVSG
ncbi:unnamed protein product [Ceutorhynchus assimilis]|uniref:Gamma-tubulin complex component n=1 Tax=Ceutorhynchus assimilis TaxID=467358 RepID=A0A9P0DKK6_9CUCU|nr:unnamed protein product [Ceutorhynchus assimilis]